MRSGWSSGKASLIAATSAMINGSGPNSIRGFNGTIEAAIRAARAKGQNKFSVGSHQYDLSGDNVHRAENATAERVWYVVHEVFERAYVPKLRSTSYWEYVPLLLIGGGSLNPRVEAAFDRKLCPYTIEQTVTRLRPTRSLLPGPGVTRQEVDQSRDFLLVAYGLSYPEPEHPGFKAPSEVPNFQKPPEAERFDANDMYAK